MTQTSPDRRARVPVRAMARIGWLALLVLLVLAVYWAGLGGGFVFDDYPNLVDNLTLRVTVHSSGAQWLAAMFSSPSSELQRPLAMLTFAANYAATGLDPYWMKLTNVFIHALNAVLVFGVVRRLLIAARGKARPHAGIGEDAKAFWISAAWALNPINLMAVLFIVQRMESLCHTFVFAGVWMYLVGRDRMMRDGRGWSLVLGGLIVGTVLGVLVKESAALLPAYALALEWALLRFESQATAGRRGLQAMFAALLFVPAIGALAWVFPDVLGPGAYAGRGFSLTQRLLTEARVLVDYLHWTVLPDLRVLSLYHDDYAMSHGWLAPASTLASALLLCGLAGLAIWLRRRRPLVSLGLAWFFIAHLITGTVLPLELVYEHRNYFASLGVCLVLGDLLLDADAVETRRRIGILVAVLLLFFYAGMTAMRAREWHDVLRFSSSEAIKHPGSPRAAYDRARNLVILTGYDPRSPYLPRALAALDQAMHTPGASTLPEAAAILTAARTGRPIDPAVWHGLQRKLREQPIGPQQTSSLESLVTCEIRFGCHLPAGEMTASFDAALHRGPNAEVMNIYGNYALNALHDPALALRLWQGAADHAPNVVAYQQTLAKMLIATGRPDLARAPIARIRRLGRFGQNEAMARDLESRIDAPLEGGRKPDADHH